MQKHIKNVPHFENQKTSNAKPTSPFISQGGRFGNMLSFIFLRLACCFLLGCPNSISQDATAKPAWVARVEIRPLPQKNSTKSHGQSGTDSFPKCSQDMSRTKITKSLVSYRSTPVGQVVLCSRYISSKGALGASKAIRRRTTKSISSPVMMAIVPWMFEQTQLS